MGNGTKVALVALLIVMVVVVAKFVNQSAAEKRAPPRVAKKVESRGALEKSRSNPKVIVASDQRRKERANSYRRDPGRPRPRTRATVLPPRPVPATSQQRPPGA